MHCFVYILYSETLDRYYVGATRDVAERLGRHLSNHSGFTSKAKDWIVKYTESFQSDKEALARERQIKKWKSRKMIEKLILSKT